MRQTMLVLGIGAGLLAMAALHSTDSVARETVVKKNFNLPKLVLPQPQQGVLKVIEAAETDEPNKSSPPGIDWTRYDHLYLNGLIFPYAHEEGHDHSDSTTRDNNTAGNSQRRSPRP